MKSATVSGMKTDPITERVMTANEVIEGTVRMGGVTGYGATEGVVIQSEMRGSQMNVMKLVVIEVGKNQVLVSHGEFWMHLEVLTTSFELTCLFVFAVEGTVDGKKLKI